MLSNRSLAALRSQHYSQRYLSRLDQYSGLGAEFVLEVSEPIVALQRLLAYHLLASHGRLGHSGAIDYGQRIPAGGPINGSKSSEISQLESGRFDFLHVVGISELERDFAKATSTDELMAKLAQHGACLGITGSRDYHDESIRAIRRSQESIQSPMRDDS